MLSESDYLEKQSLTVWTELFIYSWVRYPFVSNQAISPMDWEEYISEIASDIMKEQSPKRFVSFVPFSVVFCTITNISIPYISQKLLMHHHPNDINGTAFNS